MGRRRRARRPARAVLPRIGDEDEAIGRASKPAVCTSGARRGERFEELLHPRGIGGEDRDGLFEGLLVGDYQDRDSRRKELILRGGYHVAAMTTLLRITAVLGLAASIARGASEEVPFIMTPDNVTVTMLQIARVNAQ
jgi:hypothetical protein